MTRDKLLELYYFLKEKDIKFQEINIGDIEYLSNEDIDIVLNSKYPGLILELLQNDNIKGLNNEIITRLINAINNSKGPEQAQYAYSIATSSYEGKKDYFVSLVEVISQAAGKKQASIALLVTKDVAIIRSNRVMDFVRIIANSAGGIQAKLSFDFSVWAAYPELTNIESALELTKKISELPYEKLKFMIYGDRSILNYLYPFEKIEYVKRLFAMQKDQELEELYNMTIRKINCFKKLTEIQSKLSNVHKPNKDNIQDFNFWNEFRDNPDKAMTLLSENIDDNIELTPTEHNPNIIIRIR